MGTTEEMLVEKVMNEYSFNIHVNFIHINWKENTIIFYHYRKKTKLDKNNFLPN